VGRRTGFLPKDLVMRAVGGQSSHVWVTWPVCPHGNERHSVPKPKSSSSMYSAGPMLGLWLTGVLDHMRRAPPDRWARAALTSPPRVAAYSPRTTASLRGRTASPALRSRAWNAKPPWPSAKLASSAEVFCQAPRRRARRRASSGIASAPLIHSGQLPGVCMPPGPSGAASWVIAMESV